MRADQRTVPPRFDEDVVSPELALVDPDLGSLARTALAAPVSARPTPAVPLHETPAAVRPTRLPRRFATPILTLFATAAASLVVTAFTGSEHANGESPGVVRSPAARPVVSAPTLVWDRAAGVTSYDVELRRGSDVIYSATVSGPNATVPRTWRRDGTTLALQPEDELYVWPVVDGRRASPIVDGELAMGTTEIARLVELSQNRQP